MQIRGSVSCNQHHLNSPVGFEFLSRKKYESRVVARKTVPESQRTEVRKLKLWCDAAYFLPCVRISPEILGTAAVDMSRLSLERW